MTQKITRKAAKETTRKATQAKAGKTTLKTVKKAVQTKTGKITQTKAQKTVQKATQTKTGKTTRKTVKKAVQTKTGKTTQTKARKTTRRVIETKHQKMTLKELYRLYGEDWKNGKDSNLLTQTNWFIVNADFDPKTGDALPQALSTFLAKIAKPEISGTLHDRLWRIIDHTRDSVENVFRALNESPRREQAFLHISRVRELDASSFIKLNSRPGRNIREKLRDKPYLYAVHRFQSVDLPENRLLKEFVTRLAELLEDRYEYIKDEDEDEILPKIQSWLFGDDAKSISRWENLPPNNTLLSHRDYRRIWDAWRWLQTLDEDINYDLSKIENRSKTIALWRGNEQKYSDGCIFADMPVYFDYKEFTIEPWTDIKESEKKIIRDHTKEEISEPVCVDFAVPRPHYSAAGLYKPCILNETFIWQHWENKDKSVDIELYNSDAVFLHHEAETISSSDLFFSKDKKDEHLDMAARAFTSKFRKTFKNDTLVWLVPDFLNYFQLKITNLNINAGFSNAQHLPRSIAYIFDERLDYEKYGIHEGFSIVVIDAIGGKTCYTKLIARCYEDDVREKLIARVPETKGLYWERRPPVIIDSNVSDNKIQNYEIRTVDEEGRWSDGLQPLALESDKDILRNDERIKGFNSYIDISESPVAGGIRYYDLQQRAGDISLWRDHIPELKIKVLINGRKRKFFLVSRDNESMETIPGRPVPIPIKEPFMLPAGEQFYKFPLLQGEDEEETGYSAILQSPEFPLKEDTQCRLNLTFTYGEEKSYKLKFKPLHSEFLPVEAEWRKNEIITEAPTPSYPEPLSWENLKYFPDRKTNGTLDLLLLIKDEYNKLNYFVNRNEEQYWERVKKSIKGWCRFLLLSVWSDGRAFSDPSCPSDFRNIAVDFLELLKKISISNNYLFNDVLFLESCYHKHAPDEYIKWVTENVKNNNIRFPRSVGFSLGDVSEQWQKNVLSILVNNIKNIVNNPLQKSNTNYSQFMALRIFAYAIWYEQQFVNKFTAAELKLILKGINIMLSQIEPCPPKKNEQDKWTVLNWIRSTVEPLELLFGLLRTRESPDPEISMILQPDQKITRDLAKQVDNIDEIFEKSGINPSSRIQLHLEEKPKGDLTPDLLYALRLYLTGEGSEHMPQIISVSDNDNENY